MLTEKSAKGDYIQFRKKSKRFQRRKAHLALVAQEQLQKLKVGRNTST